MMELIRSVCTLDNMALICESDYLVHPVIMHNIKHSDGGRAGVFVCVCVMCAKSAD